MNIGVELGVIVGVCVFVGVCVGDGVCVGNGGSTYLKYVSVPTLIYVSASTKIASYMDIGVGLGVGDTVGVSVGVSLGVGVGGSLNIVVSVIFASVLIGIGKMSTFVNLLSLFRL
jgi:hypothetical protein